MFKYLILTFLIFNSLITFSSEVSREIASLKGMESLSRRLVESGDYYAATPIIKEYLNQLNTKTSSSFDNDIEITVRNVGVKQFEVLSIQKLERSEASAINYILGKKYLKRKDISRAIQSFDKVRENSFYYPLALHGKAVSQTIRNDGPAAISNFKNCIDASNKNISLLVNEKNILIDNADLCRLGLARVLYKSKDFLKSELAFLDITKTAYIWPNILLEEAWNSYYLSNYNRTLGKLVTYNAPLFDFIFEPEIDVLNSMSFYKLCLFDDAKKVADKFISKYMEPARSLRRFLLAKGKDYNFFYNLGSKFTNNKVTKQNLLNNIMKEILKDRAFQSLMFNLSEASQAYNKTKSESPSRYKDLKLTNIGDTIRLQKRIIGSYVRARIISDYAKLFNSFKDMSYIKLEILAQRKQRLYNDVNPNGKRGDIQYVARNKKQYFWDFNGEFWADELGDYVFALRSECSGS